MVNDFNSDMQRTNRGMQQRSINAPGTRPVAEQPMAANAAYQQARQPAGGITCQYCGTVNDPEALYCSACGEAIGKTNCPYCGAALDADADFCEACHHYTKRDVCSYCGARLSGNEAYCPECGNPRGGVVCPVCRTVNDFAFCKQCGTAITAEAQQLVKELERDPEYQQLIEIAGQLSQLDNCLPYSSERDIMREQANQKLRERVLTLLAKDAGKQYPQIPPRHTKRMTMEELDNKKQKCMSDLTAILDRMAVPPMPSPVKARNFAMASKPIGVRLAWVCNWKGAMHSSPCGCAKPHLGGKWVILGKNRTADIKDDK